MLVRTSLVAFSMTLAPVTALAASGNMESTNPVGAGLSLGLAIAFLARRRPIGGWLLYFYLQLYSSFLVSLFFIHKVIANLNPEVWDSSFLYVLFFLSTAPGLITYVTEIILGTMLLFHRNARNVQRLKMALLALIVTSGASLGIDLSYFNDFHNISFDIFTLIFACVWTIYFWRSKRVRLVFIERSWDWATVSAPRVLTPAERRYLTKRTVIVSGITFVALLLMMGGALGDKKPDTSIFIVPIFYALIVAAATWHSPIRKKKRDALLQTASALDSNKTGKSSDT